MRLTEANLVSLHCDLAGGGSATRESDTRIKHQSAAEAKMLLSKSPWSAPGRLGFRAGITAVS
jgi:hypothetical protein